MKIYPILLDLTDKLAVVVGCGEVGSRRAETLLACGVRVRLVDPELNEAPPEAEYFEEEYRPKHLDGAYLVFACTNVPELNERIAKDAHARGALVNVSDNPGLSDFAIPAMHRQGGVVVAVGTVGGTPALAASIRDHLAKALPAEAGDFALALASVRERLKTAERDSHKRQQLLRRLSGPEGQAAFERGGKEALLEMAHLTSATGEDVVRMDGG